jgi:hypothetical protein
MGRTMAWRNCTRSVRNKFLTQKIRVTFEEQHRLNIICNAHALPSILWQCESECKYGFSYSDKKNIVSLPTEENVCRNLLLTGEGLVFDGILLRRAVVKQNLHIHAARQPWHWSRDKRRNISAPSIKHGSPRWQRRPKLPASPKFRTEVLVLRPPLLLTLLSSLFGKAFISRSEHREPNANSAENPLSTKIHQNS